jgi:hypothetical protein
MGYFDDTDPPDSAASYFPTPPGVPRITVRPKGVEPPLAPPQLDDMSADIGLAPSQFEPWSTGEDPRGKVAPPPRTGGFFDDIVAPAARHKAAIERALSATVPLRLQHPRAVEIAAGLMADHGMPPDEALDRATMRLHAEEGTAEAGKISDVIGKDAFDEAQRAPASADLTQPAPGVGLGRAATEEQARPDGEHASGDSAPQGGDAAGEKTIGSEDAGPTDNRAQSGALTGVPMPAPQLAPQSPGLPVRPETQAPLNTPPSGWRDLPVTAPRYGVPLAVPDPNARGEGFPAPPGPTAMDRIKAAATFGFGDEPLGFSLENRAKYPLTYLRWQPLAAPLDFARRAPGAAIGAISSAGSEIYKALGGTETDANRLERDLNILGQSAMVEGGIGGRYNIGKPQANLFRTTEGAVSNEAAAPRVAIAATISPAPLRQILSEASEQSGPSPRAAPQPPARPPDTAVAQSDRMSSGARESGPFDSDATAPLVALPDGSFSITDWNGYSAGLPKPSGPFTLVKDSEYTAARRAADQANRAMHRAEPGLLGLHIHEVQPVKFGGSPTDPLNKVPLTPADHRAVTAWWNKLQRDLSK